MESPAEAQRNALIIVFGLTLTGITAMKQLQAIKNLYAACILSAPYHLVHVQKTSAFAKTGLAAIFASWFEFYFPPALFFTFFGN